MLTMKSENKLLIIIALNTLLMILEVIGSFISGSLALMSDAGHMLTDSTALVVSYIAVHISRMPHTRRKTFGWKRMEVLAAFMNGVLLLGLSIFIFYETISRFFTPVEIKSRIMLAVAFIGFLGNAFGLFILKKERGRNINLRGAYYHILGDALSSVGVIVGAVLIFFTGITVIDSLLGILIAGIIVKSAAGLIFESLNILLESAPADLSVEKVVEEVKKMPGVFDFHDVHIWSISSESRNLSGHILIDDIKASESQKILDAVRGLLDKKFKISHTTLEVECEKCSDRVCYEPRLVD